MSLSYESRLLLQAYADGEASDAEIAEAEALLRDSEEGRAFVRALPILGEATRAALPKAPAIDVADAVLARLERDEAAAHVDETPPPPRASVSSLAAARERRVQQGRIGAVLGALALAAAAVLFVRARTGGHPADGPVAQERGVEVRDLDSSEGQVSVFYLPATGAKSGSSVVVWIDEKGAP